MSAVKKVAYEVIERKLDNGRVRDCYKIMESLIEKHHPRLSDAAITLAWCYTWKPDKHGNVKLSDTKRASEVDRQLHSQDFVIILNDTAWNHSTFTDAQKIASMDHALCACDVSEDADGEVRVDENDRTVYTIRKPDIQEFSECFARHGVWNKDLEHMVGIVLQHEQEARDRPLLGSPLKKEEPKAEAAPEDNPKDEEEPAQDDSTIADHGPGSHVKLLVDIPGYNDRVNGLKQGLVLLAEPGSNGQAIVRALGGARVKLDPDQFEYLNKA